MIRFLFYFFIFSFLYLECFPNENEIVDSNKSNSFGINSLAGISRYEYLDSSKVIANELKDVQNRHSGVDDFLNQNLKLSQALYEQNYFDSSYNISVISLSIIDTTKFLDSGLLCKIIFHHGLILYRLRKFDEAHELFSKVYKGCIETGNDSILVLSLKSIGNVYFSKRNYQSALKYYKLSLIRLKSKSNHSYILISSLFQNIGISYSMLNMNDSAVYYLTESIELKEQYLEENDPMLASGYLNLSRLVQLNGELNEALKYIDKAEKIYLKKFGESDQIMAPLYYNKGSVLLTLNDFEEALHYHELAYELYKQLYENENEIFLELFINFGVINNNLGRVEDAKKYLNLALSGGFSIEQNFKGHLLLGIIYTNTSDYSKAKEHLENAIQSAEMYLGKKNFQTATAYLNYGIYCERIKDFDNALSYYLKSAEIYEEIYGKKSRDLSNIRTLIGSYYMNLGNITQALKYYQDALIAFIPDFNNQDPAVNPSYEQMEIDLNLFYTLAGKANAFYMTSLAQNDKLPSLAKCLETSKLAIRLFERIKSTLYGENTKLIVTSRVNAVYNLATSVAAEMYFATGDMAYLNTSFAYSEKSKAAVLLSTVKENTAIQVGNIPEQIQLNEKTLKRRIAQYQNLIFEENQKLSIDSIKIARIRSNLFEAKIAYDSLVSSLETKYPEYYNLKYNLDVISVEDIMSEVKNNYDAVIEYKIVDTVLYTFIVKKDTALLIKNDIDSSFRRNINRYVQQISHIPPADSVSFRSYSFAKLGKSICDILQLNNPLLKSCQKLVVIPDDVLGYLSFEALISDTPDPENSKYNKLNYLIHKYTFSYGYSGTLFFKNNKHKSRGNKVLAMAPNYKDLPNLQSIETAYGIRDLKENLIPLPYTTDEVNSISEIFSGSTLLGEAATEGNFKKRAGDYSILHFAMHTLINDDDPLASKLVFALNADTLEDGFLNTYEIYNLDLKADMAVLSACKTGAGTISKGEGIMSLARGFLYAGVPGIIMTLWAVEDMSGANIITGFYQNIYNGSNKADALRNAKLDYLAQADQLRAHPYFWAAYVQIGDNSALPINRNKYLYYGASISAVSLVLLILIWRKRRKRKRFAS